MKKIITIILAILLVATLSGCNSKQELAGGWQEAESKEVTAELSEKFEKACEGLLGASYTPIELVGTQVVAGTNYKFYCEGTKTTNPPVNGTYYVTVYEDLSGNCSILDIEVIEEK